MLAAALCGGRADAAAQTRGTAARGQAAAAGPAPGSAIAATAMAPKANAARAASASKVLFGGGAKAPKIAASRADNDVDGNPCKEEYWRCMDMFCMSDIENGGRCACSNDSIKLDKEYKETVAAVDAELGKLSSIETEIEYGGEVSGQKGGENDEDDEAECENDDIVCKIGAAKYNAAVKMCEKDVSAECKSSFSFTKLQYTQNIRSDCSAYQAAIKNIKEKGAAATSQARKSMRETAVEQFEAKNKYDEGRCVVELKKCMNGADVCGEDWTRCVGGVEEKKFHCEPVLENCAAVRDSAWDGFVAEIAPTLKSAELDAENNARQACLTRMSDCVLNACRENIDGLGETMDGCLARPEMARSFCKVELDECDETGKLWVFVKQKLAAMRTGKCADEVNECLTGENACGEDFGNCIGMDIAAVYELCPAEKLVVCKQDNPDFSISDIGGMIWGIMARLEDKLTAKCTEIAEKRMLEVCGELNDCAPPFQNDKTTHFLGAADFGRVGFSNGTEWSKCKENNAGAKCAAFPQAGTLLVDDYMETAGGAADAEKDRIKSDLRTAATRIDTVIGEIENDAKVSWCINGRDLGQIGGEGTTLARQPALTQRFRRVVAGAGLKKFAGKQKTEN